VQGAARPGGDDPTSLAAALRHAEGRLRVVGVDTPASDAARLLEAVTGLPPSLQRLHGRERLAAPQRRRLERLLHRREQREPLQLVLGETEFYGLRLRLRPGVLVPRPETEALVAHALDDVPAEGRTTLLDLGCGSGAVALALAASRPGAHVLAGDVDPRAVALTRRNARALGLDVEVLRADLLEHPRLRRAAHRARLLVANLPYLPEGDRGSLPPELDWDAETALFAGRDGLELARRARAQAWRALPRGAVSWWELDPRNAERFAREAASLGWREARLAADLTGRRRFVRFVR
jgi:release factor glutamine methyltransferase